MLVRRAGAHSPYISRAIGDAFLFVACGLVYPETMMYLVVGPTEASANVQELPPARDRMPTIPYDLTEYAWLHTGPSSWSAEPEPDDPCRSGVVHLVEDKDDDAAVIDAREAFVLSLIAPKATVADVLDLAGLPVADVLAILSNLAARGLVHLDRAA